MQETTDQKKSVYGHISRSDYLESNILIENYYSIYLNFIDQFQVRTWQNWYFAQINMQIQTTAL